MHYIGMDTSIATLEFTVIDEKGEIKNKKVITTSEKGLIEYLKGIPKPRTLYIEEGSLAGWIVEVCYRHGEKVIVMDPKQNHWICKSEEKSDPIDSIKIAQLARGNFYKEIPHAVGHRKRFRELVLYYHDTIRAQTRLKNIIKAKFRQYGINCTGNTIYNEKHQEEWLIKLNDHSQQQFMIKQLFENLKIIQKQIGEILIKIKTQCKTYAEIEYFRNVPGIGWINGATISALIENPYRFASKKKIWKYAGIGIVKKTSSKVVYSEKANKNYNRILKYTIKQATKAALSSTNFFSQKYTYLILKGIPPKRASLRISRLLLTVIWSIWKKGENYQAEKVNLVSRNLKD